MDDAGRWILVGWLGGFDRSLGYAPDGLPWCHCLTVPRVLLRDERTGGLLQAPVPELEALRGTAQEAGQRTTVSGRLADIVLSGIEGEGALTLDGSFQVFYEDGRLGIRYLDERAAAGRKDRSIPLDRLDDLRVLVDGSAVEVFANGGAETFASRWFCPEKADLDIESTFKAAGSVYPMANLMAEMYADAAGKAPTLELPGWNETVPH